MDLNIFLLLFFSYIKISYSKTPIFVISIFQNGAKSPNNLDENSKDIFNQKWLNKRKLTSIGRRMHYILGYKNYRKYIDGMNFLSLNYNPNEIYILSKNNIENIESVECQIQGLYPLNNFFSEKISENQQKKSNPPINISKSLNYEIERLNSLNSPLPEFTNTIPYHIVFNYDYEKKYEKCYNKINQIRENNLNNKDIKNLTNEFNLDFKNEFNKLFNEKGEYSFVYIEKICEDFLLNLNNGNDLSFIENYKIEKEKLKTYCEKVNIIKFTKYYFSEEKNETINIEISPLFNELLILLKNKIQTNLNKNKIIKNKKLIMFSGDEFTIIGIEIFMNKIFQMNDSIKSSFATNIFFEIYKKESNSSEYENYEVDYIINDILIKTINLKEFIEKIEKNILNENKILKFCGLKINEENNSILDLKIIIWILLIIITLLFISMIILYLKLKKRNTEKIDSFKINSYE